MVQYYKDVKLADERYPWSSKRGFGKDSKHRLTMDQPFSTTSIRQYHGCTEILNASTISCRSILTRGPTFPALLLLASSSGQPCSFKPILRRNLRGCRKLPWRCPSTIQTRRRSVFQKSSREDYSQGRRTSKSANGLRRPSRYTPMSTYPYDPRIEKPLRKGQATSPASVTPRICLRRGTRIPTERMSPHRTFRRTSRGRGSLIRESPNPRSTTRTRRRCRRPTQSKGSGSPTVHNQEVASSLRTTVKPRKAPKLGLIRAASSHSGQNRMRGFGLCRLIKVRRTAGEALKCRGRRRSIISVLPATRDDIAARHSAMTIDDRMVTCAAILLPSSPGPCRRRASRTKPLDGTRVIGPTGLGGKPRKMGGRMAKAPAAVDMIEGSRSTGLLHTGEATSATTRKTTTVPVAVPLAMDTITSNRTAVQCIDRLAHGHPWLVPLVLFPRPVLRCDHPLSFGHASPRD